MSETGRIIHLNKRREREKKDIEEQKLRLEEERRAMGAAITAKFTANADNAVEEHVKAVTVGLSSLEQIKEAQLNALAQSDAAAIAREEATAPGGRVSQRSPPAQKRILSFRDEDHDDDDGEGEGEEQLLLLPPRKRKGRLGMDPNVNTSFLPDHEREQQLQRRKEELAAEWRQLQEREKLEEIPVACCYYDGSTHTKDMRIHKGATIGDFLHKALASMRKEFPELKVANTENLMFVKEDLIIPHHHSFLDFLSTKIMGKTGPLWLFDASAEIRVWPQSATAEPEAHPVKVVHRSWFEKNKHIYPANRWEAFVPGKQYKRTLEDL